jgi:DNA repair ATPase RecN
LLYERLFDFLEYYKNTGEIEMRIISWGKNFLSKEITKLSLEIINSIESKENSEELKLSDLSKIINSFKSFIKLSLPKNDTNEILNEIEDNPIKIQDFRKKINQIKESYDKYGKNIYTW